MYLVGKTWTSTTQLIVFFSVWFLVLVAVTASVSASWHTKCESNKDCKSDEYCFTAPAIPIW